MFLVYSFFLKSLYLLLYNITKLLENIINGYFKQTKSFLLPLNRNRKNRFVMYIEGIPSYFVKINNRPTISFEEIELNHINTTRYIKGRGTWETLEIGLYDPIVPSG